MQQSSSIVFLLPVLLFCCLRSTVLASPVLPHSFATTTNHYETLNVPPTASNSELKTAYRNLARITHPDKGGDPAEFRKVDEAYKTLKDPSERNLHDFRLKYNRTQQEQRQQQQQRSENSARQRAADAAEARARGGGSGPSGSQTHTNAPRYESPPPRRAPAHDQAGPSSSTRHGPAASPAAGYGQGQGRRQSKPDSEQSPAWRAAKAANQRSAPAWGQSRERPVPRQGQASDRAAGGASSSSTGEPSQRGPSRETGARATGRRPDPPANSEGFGDSGSEGSTGSGHSFSGRMRAEKKNKERSR